MAATMPFFFGPFPMQVCYFDNTRCRPLFDLSSCGSFHCFELPQQTFADGSFDYSSPEDHKKPKSVLVMWQQPEPEWVKLNFDGGVSSGLAGCGYVLRDDMGRVLGAGCHDTPDLDVVDTELRGLWHGLKMAVKICKRGQKIWIEGDSLIVISRLQELFEYYPTDHPIARDILRLLEHFSACQASHIYREGNQVADWLATMGKFSQAAMEWLSNYPAKLQHLAWRDLHECYERVSKK